MPPTTAEINAQVKALLEKGDVAGAQKALEQKASDAPASVTAAAPAAPPEPRTFQEVALDYFTAISNLLGNHPALKPLEAELKEIVAPAKEEAPKA